MDGWQKIGFCIFVLFILFMIFGAFMGVIVQEKMQDNCQDILHTEKAYAKENKCCRVVYIIRKDIIYEGEECINYVST